MASGKLTPKQERFVQEYLIDLNATQAAIRAGYSEKTAQVQGSRLLTNAMVSDEIAKRQTKVAGKLEITQEYVIKTIHDAVERCKQAQPVLDRKGNPVLVETPDGQMVPAYVFDPKNVISGAQLLGKHIGMFKERVEHTGKDGAPIEVADVSERDMAQRAAYLLNRGLMANETAKPH